MVNKTRKCKDHHLKELQQYKDQWAKKVTQKYR